jgi:uncharacterized protein (TIGR02118 family)
MAQLIVTYKTPKDPAAFDKYYAETHIALAKKIPGLRKFQISQGPVTSLTGASDAYLIAVLTFDSAAAIQAGLASPEGQEAAADVPKFASGGADLILFDTKDV